MFSHIVDFGSHHVMNTEKEKNKADLALAKTQQDNSFKTCFKKTMIAMLHL